MPFRTPSGSTPIAVSSFSPLAAFRLVLIDLGVIGIARQRLCRRAPMLERLTQIGRVDAQLLRQSCSDGNVLRHQRELEAGCKRAAQYLQRNLALGGVVMAGRS